MPLPLTARARLFRDGIDVMVPSVRRVPPDLLTPRAKTHNYLNIVMADLEAHARDPESWAVLLDHKGNLCEGLGSNIFMVRDGELLTPHERFVLPGVSRATVIELAAELGIPCREADIDLYDAYTADEVFLTSTSLCICPVRSVNGTTDRRRQHPGPDHQAPDRRLHRAGRLRLRRAVSQAARELTAAWPALAADAGARR